MTKRSVLSRLALVLQQSVLCLALLFMSMWVFAPTAHALSDDDCKASQSYRFLGILPVWYEYIGDYKAIQPVSNGTDRLSTPTCGIVHPDTSDPADNLRNDAIAIGLAVIDILLRLGALIAVAMIMLGGYKYMSSQGEPKNLEGAMATIINAAIGLAIVLASTVLVAFVGHTLKG